MSLPNEAMRGSWMEPALTLTEITASDTVVLPPHRGFHANADGNVILTDLAGIDHTIVVLAGETYWYAFTKIKATSVSVTGIPFNTGRY